MKKFGTSLLALLLVLSPAVVLAGEFTELEGFAGVVIEFINGTLIPLIFALALLVFIWGMFNFFILGGGDEGKREQGKSLMLYAILGFVLMIVIFGIVNLIANGLLSGLGTDNTAIDSLPGANTTN